MCACVLRLTSKFSVFDCPQSLLIPCICDVETASSTVLLGAAVRGALPTILPPDLRKPDKAERRKLQEQQRREKAARVALGKSRTRPAPVAAVAAPPPDAARPALEAAPPPPLAVTGAAARGRLLSVLRHTTKNDRNYNGSRFPAGYHTWHLPADDEASAAAAAAASAVVVRGERDPLGGVVEPE